MVAEKSAQKRHPDPVPPGRQERRPQTRRCRRQQVSRRKAQGGTEPPVDLRKQPPRLYVGTADVEQIVAQSAAARAGERVFNAQEVLPRIAIPTRLCVTKLPPTATHAPHTFQAGPEARASRT
eukprot:scaffold79_cov259-Pinguiococcus_pyrenoidosus.AAC.13